MGAHNQKGVLSIKPPHDEEAESATLGAILLANNWLPVVADRVGVIAEDFYRPRHRLVYAGILDAAGAGEPVDTLTLSAHLESRGKLAEAGGRDYIETLATRIPAIGNTKRYAQIVRELAMLRGLLSVSYAIQQAIDDGADNPAELAEKTLRAVGDAIRPESGEVVGADDRVLWAADFAIRGARQMRSERDAYTLLALSLRKLEASYDDKRERREALNELAGTALYAIARELPKTDAEGS